MRPGKNIKIFLNYIVGPLIFLFLGWSLYQQVLKQPNLEAAWKQIKENFFGIGSWQLLAVILLMGVNWTIEAVKWQISVYRVKRIRFITAFKAVLSGLSFSVTMPNRVGEYLGRMLYMPEGKRLRIISLTILSSCSQLLITLLAGLMALYFLQDRLLENQLLGWEGWISMILYGGTMLLGALTFFYFRLNLIARWMDKLSFLKKYSYLVTELGHIDATLLFRILSLSAIRFLVFLIQYWLVYQFFEVDMSLPQLAAVISLMFLVLAFIPTIAMVELGLRGEISLTLGAMFSQNLLGIGLATVSIWFINLFLPAAIGSLLILSVKLFKRS